MNGRDMRGRPYALVIGDPVAHSKSPLIHRFWLEECGIDAEYGVETVAEGKLAGFLARHRANPAWRGANVTMPHKQAILPLLDLLDPLAKRIGAVNTVVRQSDGALVGYNTDAGGFLEPLRPLLARPHLFRMARIVGTGGAARAVVAALADEGFTLVLIGRDPAKARAILDELAPDGEHHTAPLSHFAEPTDFVFDDREGILDLVVNASPLGMDGQPPLVLNRSHIPPGSVLYDIVTVPRETSFLKTGRADGAVCFDGMDMLLGQAVEAFERFFEQPPLRARDGDLRQKLYV